LPCFEFLCSHSFYLEALPKSGLLDHGASRTFPRPFKVNPSLTFPFRMGSPDQVTLKTRTTLCDMQELPRLPPRAPPLPLQMAKATILSAFFFWWPPFTKRATLSRPYSDIPGFHFSFSERCVLFSCLPSSLVTLAKHREKDPLSRVERPPLSAFSISPLKRL